MTFDLIPDRQAQRSIVTILDAQVQGPYRFVHHALLPYVRIGPAFADEPITIYASDRLQLRLYEGHGRGLQGLEATMDFAVVFAGTGVKLVDIGLMPDARVHAQKALDALMLEQNKAMRLQA